jgi:hypothetical protein
VHHDLGAERLAQLDLAAQPPVGGGVRLELGVLEVLGPDPEDDAVPLVGAERGADRERLVAEPDLRAPIFATSPPFARSSVASIMFMAGLPMKPPTKRLTGRS